MDRRFALSFVAGWVLLAALIDAQTARRAPTDVIVVDVLGRPALATLVTDCDTTGCRVRGERQDGALPAQSAWFPLPEGGTATVRMPPTQGGIGVFLHGGHIDELLPGHPADLVGVQAGDRIVEVDGADVRGAGHELIRERLAGPVGSSVWFVVERGGQRLSFTAHRDFLPEIRP